MSKINNLNSQSSLKNKLKSFLSIVAVFCLLAISSQVKTYSYIPLKGLFNVLKYDHIGFAHALLRSKWIENVYQYAEGQPHKQRATRRNRQQWKAIQKNDAVANLVRLFWFRVSEDHQLIPTQFGPLGNIPNERLGAVFGKLINYIYRRFPQEQEDALIDELVKYDPEYQQFKRDLVAYLREVHNQEETLEDEKFTALKGAKKIEQEEINRLQEKYKMAEFNQAIARASKEWGKKKGFSKVRKEIERKFDVSGYRKALKEAKKRIFAHVTKETKGEYGQIQVQVKKIDAAIARMVKKKRETIKKMLFDPIRKALEFRRKSKRYVSGTVATILWALFFDKLDNLASQEEKIEAINACFCKINNGFKNKSFRKGKKLQEQYRKKDFYSFKKKFRALDVDKQNDAVCQDYDIALHAFMQRVGEKFPPVITMGSYGYEYQPGKISYSRPDCHETATLDALSVLWYNPVKKALDDSLFSDHVIQNGQGLKRLREALKYFYLADVKGIKAKEYTCEYRGERFTSLERLRKLTETTPEGVVKLKITPEEVEALNISEIPVAYITRSEIKQEFMNIISGVPGVIYCSKVPGKGRVFELDSDVRNVLAIFNYFYGTRAQDFGQLGDKDAGISTDYRLITFKKKNDNNAPNKITIRVNDQENDSCFCMIMYVGGEHTELSVSGRRQKDLKVLRRGFIDRLLSKKEMNIFRRLAVFALSASNNLLKDKGMCWYLSGLNILYYSLEVKRVNVKMDIIEHALLRYPQYYDEFKEMIRNLIENIPLNDQHLKGKLGAIIVKSGFYEKDQFFKDFIKIQVLNDPMFYKSSSRVKDIFDPAFEQKNKDIILQMINHPKFSLWGHSLYMALQEGSKEIAQQIIEKDLFDASQDEVGKALVLALQNKEYASIAEKILKNPKFTGWSEAVGFALEQGDKNIVLQLLENSQCNLEKPLCGYSGDLIKGLGSALEKSGTEKPGAMPAGQCCELVLQVLRHSTFDYREKNLGYGLKTAIEKGYDSVVAEIIKQPKLKMDGDFFGHVLRLAIEKKEHKYVALALVNNPRLWWSTGARLMKECLELALEKGLTEIAVAIAKHPNFNLNDRCTNGLFEQMFKKGHREVVFAFFENSRFAGCSQEVKEVLLVALERKDMDLVVRILRSRLFKWWAVAFQKALDLGGKAFVFEILDHPNFDPRHHIFTWARKKGFKGIMQKLIRHPRFKHMYLDTVLRDWFKKDEPEYRDLLLEIVSRPKFKAGSSAVIDLLTAALKHRCKDIALAIVKNPTCDFKRYDSKGEALLLALRSPACKDVALAIMEHPTFQTWGRVLKVALKEGHVDVALEIVNSPVFLKKELCFNAKDEDADKALVLALKNALRSFDSAQAQDDRYKEIADKILNHPGFNRWTPIVGLLIEQVRRVEPSSFCLPLRKTLSKKSGNDSVQHKEILLKLLEHPRCNLGAYSIDQCLYGHGSLYYALEKGWRQVVLKIIRHETFDFSKYKMGGVLALAMEKGYAKISSEIIDRSLFDVADDYTGHVLAAALHDESYKKLALKIEQDSRFDGWKEAVVFAAKKGWKKIVLKIMENPAFWSNGMDLVYVLENILKAGYRKIALDIVNHSMFKLTNGFLVSGALRYARRHAQEGQNARQEYQEIVDIIEEKLGDHDGDYEDNPFNGLGFEFDTETPEEVEGDGED